MPKANQDFKGISLKRELVEEIERFVTSHSAQYKSVADFVHEAARLRLQELKSVPGRFEHFNINSEGVRVTDRERHIIADIYFKPSGIFCDVDKSSDCEHIDFALTVPKIRDVVIARKKEGWKLPDLPDF